MTSEQVKWLVDALEWSKKGYEQDAEYAKQRGNKTGQAVKAGLAMGMDRALDLLRTAQIDHDEWRSPW
jgi:hypothetical protein